MKYTPATALFLAAYVLLALSAPPTALAQNHGSSLRHPVHHTTRRVARTADDDDDEQNDDQDDTTTTTPPPASKIPPSNGNCRRQVRQEIRDLTDDQRMRYFRAIRAIMRRPTSNAPSEYDRMVYEHYHYNRDNHGFPAFLPWHRIFIRRFEVALQRVDPSIVIPYWDWSADAQAPELSPIFRPDWYGGNGNPRRRLCIEDGYFKDFKPYYSSNNAGCLTRNWDNGDHSGRTGGRHIGALASPELVAKTVAQSRDYKAFRISIEQQPHGAVHNNIGGKGGIFSSMYSPADPLFWLHHAMIDKIFMDWQLLAPSTRVNQFMGKDVHNQDVTPNSMLVAYNVPARVGLQFNVMGACISYAPAVNAYRNRRVPPPPPRHGGSTRPTRPTKRPPPKKRPVKRRIIRRPPPRRHHLVRRGNKLSTADDISQVVPGDDNEFSAAPSKGQDQAPPAQAPQDAAPEVAAPGADAAPEATAPLAQAEVNPPVEAGNPDTQKTETKAVNNEAATSTTEAPKADESKKAEEPTKTEEPNKADDKKPQAKTDEAEKTEEPTKTEPKKEEPKETGEPKEEKKEETKLQVPSLSNSTLSANSTANNTDLSGTDVVVIDAPKPSDLPKTCTDDNGVSVPCPDDRENILDLRAPASLPDWWLEMNNLDVESTRKQEEESRKVVSKLNALDGYISPAALWNKDDFLAELAKKGTDFKCVYKGKVIKVDYDKDSVTTGYRTIEKVKKQIEYVGVPTYKPIDYLEPKLNKILGHKTVKRLKKKFEKTPTVYKEITYNDDDDVCEADDY